MGVSQNSKAWIAAILLAVVLVMPATVMASAPPEITAASAVLMERDSGRVLFAVNEQQKRPMASTTKIMTAILALELGNLQDQVRVSYNAAAFEGSSLWLEPGEVKTLEELVYGLMLVSGNDAAAAIAEHIGGSVPEFARMMTEKAAALGARNTSFRNPHGLDADGHYTTAYDLGLITAYALKNPTFRKIIATPEKTISWPGQEWDRHIRNQNKLLEEYEGGDGVKTGWTTPAGRCFVGSATRNNMQLITVVLNAPQMWEDAIALLDYGFAHYRLEEVLAAGRPLKTARVEKGREDQVTVMAARKLLLPLMAGEKEKLSYRFRIDEPLTAPLAAGQEVGTLEVSLGEQVLGTVPLAAAEEVRKARPLEFLFDFIAGLLE